jgi:hypothetical protein
MTVLGVFIYECGCPGDRCHAGNPGLHAKVKKPPLPEKRRINTRILKTI